GLLLAIHFEPERAAGKSRKHGSAVIDEIEALLADFDGAATCAFCHQRRLSISLAIHRSGRPDAVHKHPRAAPVLNGGQRADARQRKAVHDIASKTTLSPARIRVGGMALASKLINRVRPI